MTAVTDALKKYDDGDLTVKYGGNAFNGCQHYSATCHPGIDCTGYCYRCAVTGPVAHYCWQPLKDHRPW